MHQKLISTICLLFTVLSLAACSTDESNHVLLPWETETGTVSSGSVSDHMMTNETAPKPDDSLPYWIFPDVAMNGGGIFYIDEEERNLNITDAQQEYDMLKQAPWNSEDPDVLTNGNIETLIKTLNQIGAEDRPGTTYSQMKVKGLCDNIEQYFGDFMWWDAITVKECKVIEDETADTLNGGKPYTLVTAETYFGETIYLYVMDADAGMDYYSQPDIQNMEGYPVGISGDAIVLCMVPYDAGNI